MAEDPVLQEIVGRIASGLPVSRIILFGSHAHGDVTPDSDYDLAVIWDTPLDRLDRGLSVLRQLRGLPVAVDVLTFTPEEFATGLGARYLVWKDIRERGRMVFDADAVRP